MSIWWFISFCILVGIGIVIFAVKPFMTNGKEEQKSIQAERQVQSSDNDNIPLTAPCTITIKLNYTNEIAIKRGWRYGFSLNGAEPKYELLGSVMTLTTEVEQNTLLGYGNRGMSGYKAAAEQPFLFSAVSGGEIKLKADIYSTTQGYNLSWKSNLSFDE